MCGIAGIHGQQDAGWIESMLDIIRHRGSDSGGVYRSVDDELTFGMRRLAIIDIRDGEQPMSTTDGNMTIIFNGEIYNAPELRRDMEKKGVEFITHHSDTEVLLQLYRLHGPGMLKMLNGMFAFSIYDKPNNKIFCARDRVGIKPFYYRHDEKHFIFSSELKALFVLPFVSREVNRQSLFHYMSLMYVPGENTIISGIKRLPAGSYLEYKLDNRRCEIKRWWQPDFESCVQELPRAEVCEQIRYKLSNAVKRWSLSDVPIACSLSGGLDSSAIVGLLAESGVKVTTYSLGFTGKDEDIWNELPQARTVARKWNTEHHELVLAPDDLLNKLLDMVWHLDEPYGGGLPSWSIFELMSRDFKVGMTGTGGDELFGNYGKWRFLEGRIFRKTSSDSINEENFEKLYFDRFYYCSDYEKRANVFGSWSAQVENTSHLLWEYYASARSETIRDSIANVDINTQLPEEFLMMTDRFSMAHSLEARTPFLDHEFIEYMFSIPDYQRMHRKHLKKLLKDSIADLLPAENLNSPKKGFVIPLTLWLRGKLRPLVERILAPERLHKQGLFRPEFYNNYVKPHIEGHADHTNKVWAALMFQLWHYLYVEQHTKSRPDCDTSRLTSLI